MTPTIELESELLPSDLEFDRMRDDLLARLDEPARLDPPIHLAPRKRNRAKHASRAIGAGVLVAAAVAATLIVTNVTGPRGATAEAAEVLHGAALAAVGSSDPIVGPGQYLKVDTAEASMLFGDHAAVLTHQQVTLYVPSDRSDNWILVRRGLPAGTQYGDATSLIRDWEEPGADGHKYGDVVLRSAVAGHFASNPYPFAELAELPSTETALSNYLYSHVTGEQSKDQEVYGEIRQLLDYGLVPAKTRAAMYGVLADIPGVYLSQGKANLDGQTGVGISLLDSTGNYIQQIIIDPTTGLLIGTRDLDVTPAGKVPAGVSQDWTAVTTSVVDSAPTGPFATEQQPG